MACAMPWLVAAAAPAVALQAGSACPASQLGNDSGASTCCRAAESGVISSRCIERACASARHALAHSHTSDVALAARPVHFFHIHKSGGTAMCAHAKASLGRRAVAQFGEANCNLMPGDGPHTLAAGCFGLGNANLSCASRASLVSSLGIQFFATERWLDDAPSRCGKLFRHVTILREPLARLRSSLCVHNQGEQRLLGWAIVRGLVGAACWEAPRGFKVYADGREGRWDAPLGAPTFEGHGSVSNHLTRSLLGGAAYFRGALNVSDVKRAARVLETRFDAVAVLEAPCTLHAMSRGLGWNDWPEGPVNSAASAEGSCKAAGWRDGADGVLCAANALDIALYAAFQTGHGLGACSGGAGAAGLPPRDECSAAEAKRWLRSCVSRCVGVTQLDMACRALLRQRCGAAVSAAAEDELAPPPTFAVLVLEPSGRRTSEDEARRGAIRASWLGALNEASSAADGKPEAIARFVIGGAAAFVTRMSPHELRPLVAYRQRLALEVSRHRDVWLVDARDDASSSMLRLRAGFEALAAQLRPTYVIKADADVWVSWPSLTAWLARVPPQRLYAGHVLRGASPADDRRSFELGASSMGGVGVSYDTVPYCSGSLYALSADLLRLLAASPPPAWPLSSEGVAVGASLLPYNVTPVDLKQYTYPGGSSPSSHSGSPSVSLGRSPPNRTGQAPPVLPRTPRVTKGIALGGGGGNIWAPGTYTRCRRDGVVAVQNVAPCCMGELARNVSMRLPLCRSNGCNDCREEAAAQAPSSAARRAALLTDAGSHCLRRRSDGPRRSLLAIAASVAHLPAVAQLLPRFDAAEFDVWIMHYDADTEANRDAWRRGLERRNNLSHVWRPGFVKLDFARAELGPAAVCEYEYLLLWDGDGLPAADFDGGSFVRSLALRNVSIAQPTLTQGSASSYEFNRQRRVSRRVPFRRTWMVEVGFLAFSLNAWLRVHTLWSAYEFKFWWFDTLPWGCLLADDGGLSGSVRVGVTDEHALEHREGGKTLRTPGAYIGVERRWRDEILEQYGCCAFIESLKPRRRTDPTRPGGRGNRTGLERPVADPDNTNAHFKKCACDGGASPVLC